MDDQETIYQNKERSVVHKVKKKTNKIFRIIKSDRANEYVKEILGESDEEMEQNQSVKFIFSNEEDPISKDTRSTFLRKRRVDPSSKVNFAKLSIEEKEKRLQNLAILVKKMKRKLKNIDQKLKRNASKLLNKFMKDFLKKHKNEFSKKNFKEMPLINYDHLSSAISVFHTHNVYEFEDEKYLIPNLLSLISGHKLSLDSLEFKHICSIIRPLLSQDSEVIPSLSSISQVEQNYISRFAKRKLNGEFGCSELSQVYYNFLLCKEKEGRGEGCNWVNEKESPNCTNNNTSNSEYNGNSNIISSVNSFRNQISGFVPFIFDNRNYFNTFNAVPFGDPFLGSSLRECNNVAFGNTYNTNNSIQATEMLNNLLKMFYERISMTNPNLGCNETNNSYRPSKTDGN